jgi:hypothetical protein
LTVTINLAKAPIDLGWNAGWIIRPLSLPKVPFAHHEAVAQKEGHAFDELTFYVVLPMLNEHVVRERQFPDHVYIGPIYRGFISPKLLK